MKKYVYGAAIFLLIATVGYYFWNGKEKQDTTPAGQVQRVLKVTKGDLNLAVSANGVVNPINKVEIRSKASGQIFQLNFVEGQYANKGDLLIVLDSTTTKNDLDQAKADLAVAEANLSQSKNSYARTKELFSKGLVSTQDNDQANVDYVKAQSQFVKARAVLSTAEDRMKDTRILAPVSGIILSKSVEVGQIISSAVSNVGGGTLLATIADMDEVYVDTNVDEVDIGKVSVGQHAKVVADAFPDDSFAGEVERIAPLGKTLQNVTTFNVVIRVKNIGGKLKAGMSTSVEIVIFNRKDVVVVPNEALKDPNSDQGKALMVAANLTLPKEATAKRASEKSSGKNDAIAAQETNDPQKMRERFQNASPEEREKMRTEMRAGFEKMSPEERQKAFDQMRQRFQQQGGGQGGAGTMFRGEGGFPTGEGSPGAAPKMRRQAQVGKSNDEKWRIVVVKESGEFKARIIKVGPSNFDYSEILDGLNEGDEIQITNISRAKLASIEQTQRLKSMQGVGGIGGGGGRGMGGR